MRDSADIRVYFAGLIPERPSLSDLFTGPPKDDRIESWDLMKSTADWLSKERERFAATGCPAINRDVRWAVNEFPLFRMGSKVPVRFRWCGH